MEINIPDAKDLLRKCSFQALDKEQQTVVIHLEHALLHLMQQPQTVGGINIKKEGIATMFLTLRAYFSLYGYELERLGPNEIYLRWRLQLDTITLNLR